MGDGRPATSPAARAARFLQKHAATIAVLALLLFAARQWWEVARAHGVVSGGGGAAEEAGGGVGARRSGFGGGSAELAHLREKLDELESALQAKDDELTRLSGDLKLANQEVRDVKEECQIKVKRIEDDKRSLVHKLAKIRLSLGGDKIDRISRRRRE